MVLDESGEHFTELFCFVCPLQDVGFVKVTCFYSDPDLSPEFAGWPLGDGEKSGDFRIAVSFIAFRNV